MSGYGKIFLLISAFAFILLLTCRIFLGGWISYLYVPLALFLISFLAALVVDIRFYAEFLTLRTTKHGLNMGAMISLTLVFLVLMNFFSLMKDKSWDLTQNKLNTLSPGTLQLLESIDQQVTITTYYRGSEDRVKKLAAKQLFNYYKQKNSNLKSYFVDSYVSKIKAENDLKNYANKEEMISLVQYKDRVIRVETPLNEENMTSALIRATRKEKKVIYFLTGHGEKSIHSKEAGGLLVLKTALESMAFQVKEFNFIMTQVKIPEEASVVALVGPRLKLFENEVFALQDYVNQGGRLLVAADPGLNHDVDKLLSRFGVLFRNNYIIAEVAEKLNRSATSALGLQFDGSSSITRPLLDVGHIYSLFELTSELNTVESNKESEFQYRPLVQSAPESFTINELKVEVSPGVRSPKTIAVEVIKKENPKFGLVVFGDSDFMTNKDISLGVNKRLALNSFSFLATESDLIQVPEKPETGTTLIMTGRLRDAIVMAGFTLPMILLMFSGFLYYRRKKA